VRSYDQYCPIARSSELLAERWTPIIVRNLLNGCRTFNEIRQGAPGVPTALLAQRLETLARCGVVERTPNPSGRGWTYELSERGRALQPVLDAMGQWGARWLEIEPQHLDPAYTLWATTKLVDHDRIPEGTTVVRIDLADAARHYWIVLRRPRSELCTTSAGHTEDMIVRTDTDTLVSLHLERLSYDDAVRSGRVRLEGPPRLTRRFRSWFTTSPFAAYLPDGGAVSSP
jgi:DNA-binding HxlR family transcriptional regulator